MINTEGKDQIVLIVTMVVLEVDLGLEVTVREVDIVGIHIVFPLLFQLTLVDLFLGIL